MTPRENDFYVLPTGERYPRVTAILKSAFPFSNLSWAARMSRDETRRYFADAYHAAHPTIEGRQFCVGLDTPSFVRHVVETQGDQLPHDRKDAANIGTALHKYAEAIMRIRLGQNVRVPTISDPTVQNTADSFHAWLDAHVIEPVRSEERLVSRAYGYAGTADLTARVDGLVNMIDFKTSKGIFIDYPVQLSAYRQAAIEMGNVEPPMGGLIVRFPKEPGDAFEAVDVPWEWQDYLFQEIFVGVALARWKHQAWHDEHFPYRRRR